MYCEVETELVQDYCVCVCAHAGLLLYPGCFSLISCPLVHVYDHVQTSGFAAAQVQTS